MSTPDVAIYKSRIMVEHVGVPILTPPAHRQNYDLLLGAAAGLPEADRALFFNNLLMLTVAVVAPEDFTKLTAAAQFVAKQQPSQAA